MITVTTTTPSAINTTITPVVDGAANPATVSTTTPSDAFSSTLNTQMGLVSSTGTDATTLATTQAALLASTSATDSVSSTLTTLTTQQPAALNVTDANTQNPTLLTSQAIAPDMAMTEADSAILSTVNDTLKFIATGSKLGDTLQAGQSVQVPSTNLTTSLTQETVQSAVQQAITNTQVNTPAAVVAQQAMPVQVGQVAVETPETDAVQNVVLSQVQNAIAAQTETVETTAPTPQTQVQTPVVQAESETLAKSVAITTQAQVQTPVAQTETAEKATITTQAQVQTPVAQTETAEKATITVQAQVQTPIAQTETAEKATITTQTQVQTPVVTGEAVDETVLATQTQIATPEKSVVAASQAQVQASGVQAKTETAEKPAVVAQQAQVQRVITDSVETSSQAIVSAPAQKIVEQQVDKTGEENTPTDSTLLVQTATQTVAQHVVEQNVVEQDIAKPETPKTENQEAQPALVAEQNIAPLVVAQAAPTRVEAEPATFETSSVHEDKPTLTPAKDLLADILANRNNGGDMAGNSGDKKGSDTPSNTVLQADNLLKNSPDSKQGVETKSFASLLSAEKPDVASATQATSIGDKSAPQVMAAVNKLADSIKTDVPALTRPLSHPDWNQEMGERIVWMNNRGISSAEIRMNPQNMGPITVRIDMNQDQASIAFTAQNADVRTALEASIPKLREMLSSQNVNLADVNVSQQSSTNADSSRSQQQATQMAADASANGQGGNRQNQEVDANGNVVRGVNANGEEMAADEFANGQVLQDNGANGLLSIFA